MSAVRAKTYDELLDDLVAAQGELENLRIRVAVGKELQDALRAEGGHRMIERITVELTPDELWALDTAAIYALEKRTMPTHIEMDVRPKLGSAIKALHTAEERARKGKKDAK